MKVLTLRAGVGTLLFLSFVAHGQVVLRLDFNDRSSSMPTNNLAGFDPFAIGTVGSAMLIQTNPTTLTFGALTVTLSGNGANPGYDDRLRPTPGDSGTVPSAPLYRDFVFSTSTTTDAGLNVTIDGLTADQLYKVTIWSFDSGSTGSRVSDWFANGAMVKDNYTFDGSALPASDTQYQFNFTTAASATGQLFIQGRRDASSASFGVFINALQVEVGAPEATAITRQPASMEVFAGDNVLLSADASGTPPLSFQWRKDGVDIEDATNRVLLVASAQAGDAGPYTVAVANSVNSVVSDPASVTVLRVLNINSGLVGHWPLDILEFSTPDVTPNMNELFQANMDALNVEEGRIVSGLGFNGADEYVVRTNNGTTGLPLYGSPAYSVALWVKGVGTGQNDRRVWSESADTNNNPLMTIGTHQNGTDGTVDIFIRGNAGGIPVNHRRTSLIAFDGSWHHIAWVDNNGFGRVYVDGVPDTNDFNYARVPLQGNILSLGAVVRTNVVAQYNGLIDDVHAWRRSLSEEEVRLAMNQVRILSLKIVGGNVELTFATANTAAPHRIEERTDFSSGSWSEVMGVNFSAPSGNVVVATFPAPMGGQRFYRAAF